MLKRFLVDKISCLYLPSHPGASSLEPFPPPADPPASSELWPSAAAGDSLPDLPSHPSPCRQKLFKPAANLQPKTKKRGWVFGKRGTPTCQDCGGLWKQSSPSPALSPSASPAAGPAGNQLEGKSHSLFKYRAVDWSEGRQNHLYLYCFHSLGFFFCV